MATLSFFLLLLIVAGAAAAGDGCVSMSHLQLRGIDAPQGPGLMDYLQFTHGCGRFAALLAATANAGETFREHVIAGTGGGLTIFCPDDLAVAAFEPKFNNLSAGDQLAVVLYHGAVARYGREQIAAFDSVAVRTLATDAATNKSHVLTVLDDGETLWVGPSSRGSGGRGVARVTKEVASGEFPLAVYVVDGMLLPIQLQQRLDGGDEAAACTPRGGYLGWMRTIPVWGALCLVASTILGAAAGLFMSVYFCSRMQR